jgi:hypothetical protein
MLSQRKSFPTYCGDGARPMSLSAQAMKCWLLLYWF